MLNAIIDISLRNRFMVLIVTAVIAGLGVYSAFSLPIDAVPDLTNVQVQVITEAPAMSPEEVELLLSFPVEGAMSGLPGVEQIRSISKFGISVVTIVFREGTDIYRARQLVNEDYHARWRRSPRATAPRRSGRSPPRSAKSISFRSSPRGSRRWSCGRSSIGSSPISYVAVPGVTEINTHGGELKTYQVEIDPDKLANYQLSITDVFRALRSNNANVGGGYIVRDGEARYIRGVSQARSIADIESIVVDERDGVPVTIDRVAKVENCADDSRRLGHARRPGGNRHRACHDADRRKLAAGRQSR